MNHTSLAIYLTIRILLEKYGRQSGRIVREQRHSVRGMCVAHYKIVKYIHRVVATYLTEETEKDVPKGLSMVDLKLIAIEANAVETSKVGLPEDAFQIFDPADVI